MEAVWELPAISAFLRNAVGLDVIHMKRFLLCTYLQSHPLSLLKEEIKQSFVNLSSIIDPDVSRKRKITLKEWTNWLQHDHLSEAECKMFNDNPEHVNWRKNFLEFSENREKITHSQVKRMKKSNVYENAMMDAIIRETGKCLKSNLKDCFKAKNKETDFLTWTEFVHWINSLCK